MDASNINIKQDFPKLSEFWAITCIAISASIMAYSHIFGLLFISIFYAIWLPRLYYKKTFILKPSAGLIFMALLPLLCLASFFWSYYPGISLYKGIEFASLIACMAIISRITSTETFVIGIAFGMAFVLMTTVLTDISLGRAGDLLGLHGSKNMVGFYATIEIIAAILLLFSKQTIRNKLAFYLPALLLGIICLAMSHSAAALLSVLAVLGLLFAMVVISKLPNSLKVLMIGMALFFGITVITTIIAFDVDVQGEVLSAVGKDRTLTGRTYLWSEGIDIGSKHPIAGHGYAAFWVHGQPDAERYWEEFFITGRSGFHFHNLFIETYVQLGIIGTIIMLSLLLYVFSKSSYWIISSGMSLESGFVFCIASLYIIRSIVEVGVLGPFGMGSFLFYSLILRQNIDKLKPLN